MLLKQVKQLNVYKIYVQINSDYKFYFFCMKKYT